MIQFGLNNKQNIKEWINIELNIKNSEHAYFIGFAQADGSLYEQSRNRGRFSIELQRNDREVLEKLSSILDCNYTITERIRDTNFKENYSSCCLNIYNLDFRNNIKKYLCVGKKSDMIKEPKGIIKNDYFRGIIDGDGSIGFTSEGFPFVSLVTDSQQLAIDFLDYIKELTEKQKTATRNTRDNVFNIMVTKEDAQILVQDMYYSNCISLKRKFDKSLEILNWKRPYWLKKVNSKRWDKEQDEYILNHTIEESIKILERTESSIKNRLFRLSHE